MAKSNWNLDQLKARAKDNLEKHGHLDPAAYAKLYSLLSYSDGDYADLTTFRTDARLSASPSDRCTTWASRPACSPPLAKADCVKNARVVVEKPFGRDLPSAQELNRTLPRFFPETSIFRIDHFLGKEPVQNLVYFRFANESFGVAGRGKFYEEVGAIRDVVQNHMLQVIACLAEECPAGNDHEARRDERGRLFKTGPDARTVGCRARPVPRLPREPGDAPDSKVETFAAAVAT